MLLFALPLLSKAQWTRIADLPGVGADGCFSATINGKGYVGGGTGRKSLYEYDPVSNTWTRKADIPGPSQRAWAGSFVAEGNLYVIGGDSTFGGLLQDVWMYNPTSDLWTRKADYPGGRRDGMLCWAFNAVNLKTKVFAGGGFDGQYILQDFYEYEPVTDTWKTISDGLPSAMLFASGFVLNNKGYATFWEGGTYHNSTWEFDPVNYTWTEKASCPGSPRGEGIGFSAGNYGYAGLGQTDFEKTYTDIYRYNPSSDEWTKMTDAFPANHTGWSCAFVIGSVVYAGTGTTLPDFTFSNHLYKQSLNGSDITAVMSGPGLKVSVNSINNTLTYITTENISEVIIYDVTGKLVLKEKTTVGNTIPLGAISEGMYTVLFYGSDKAIARKIMIP